MIVTQNQQFGRKGQSLWKSTISSPHKIIDVASKTRDHKTRGNTIFKSRFLRKPSK